MNPVRIAWNKLIDQRSDIEDAVERCFGEDVTNMMVGDLEMNWPEDGEQGPPDSSDSDIEALKGPDEIINVQIGPSTHDDSKLGLW